MTAWEAISGAKSPIWPPSPVKFTQSNEPVASSAFVTATFLHRSGVVARLWFQAHARLRRLIRSAYPYPHSQTCCVRLRRWIRCSTAHVVSMLQHYFAVRTRNSTVRIMYGQICLVYANQHSVCCLSRALRHTRRGERWHESTEALKTTKI